MEHPIEIDPVAETEALVRALQRLQEAVLERPGTSCGGWTVVQHAEHVRIAIQRTLPVFARLERATDAAPEPKPPLTERARQVLLTERIPVGAQAPAPVQPGPAPDPQAVLKALAELQSALRSPPPTGRQRTFPHPVLGPLDGAEWLRFTRIHTEHHLRLIQPKA